MNELNILQDSLEEWINKWKEDSLTYKENIEKAINVETTHNYNNMIIQRNSMIYLAQWIINSINGGIDKVHATNICNIILKEK